MSDLKSVDILLKSEPKELQLIDAEQLEDLKKVHTHDTSLISVYTTNFKNFKKSKLSEELSKVRNIKSTDTRQAVQKALRKLMHFDATGHVAIFAGEDSSGKVFLKYFQIEKEIPQLYRCGKEFYLDPLETIIDYGEKRYYIGYGPKVVFAESDDYKSPTVVWELTNNIPKKHSKGGQSKNRFENIGKTESQKMANTIVDVVHQNWGHNIGKVMFSGSSIFFNTYLKDHPKDFEFVFFSTGNSGLEAIREIIAAHKCSPPRLQWENEVISYLLGNLSNNLIAMNNECQAQIDIGNVKTLVIHKTLLKDFIEKNKDNIYFQNLKIVTIRYGAEDGLHSQFLALSGIMCECYSNVMIEYGSESEEFTW